MPRSPASAPESTLDQLKRVSKSHEAYHVSIFELMRHHPGGRVQTIEVRVRDAGPGAKPRFYVSARDDQGRRASGHHDARLEVAIGLVHWEEFDK